MKTVLFVLFLGICCEATDAHGAPFVPNLIKVLSAKTGHETPSQTTVYKGIEERQLHRLRVKDILSRLKRSSNSCPPYHYPVSPGNCEPCICGKGEQPKENCGYGPDGPVSDRCEPCGDNHFSTDGRINGCEVCTNCGQRGFQTTCNRTQDATCACEEGQKLGKTDQCLPVCCKCRGSDSPDVTDNLNACLGAFGSPAKDGGYLCTDNELYAYQPCQDYQPPTTPHPSPGPTTTPKTTVTNETTPAQGTTISATNKTLTSTVVERTTTLSDNTTMTPVGPDKPPQGDGNWHLKLVLGLSIPLPIVVLAAAVGIGCHGRKICNKLKCLKKCWNHSKPPTDPESKKVLLPGDPSDTESGPEGPPVRPSSPNQLEEQEETGVTEGQGGGQPDDAVPIAAGDGIELSEMKDEQPQSEDQTQDESEDSISNKSDSDAPTEPKSLNGSLDMPEEGSEDEEDISDANPNNVNGQEECDRFREVPDDDWIEDLPLRSILNEQDLLDKLKVLLEQEERTHYKNIGSKLFKLCHDKLEYITFHRVSTSPTVAVLQEGVSKYPNMKIRRLLHYVTGELKRQDVANCIIKYFTELGKDVPMAKLKQ